MGGRYWIEEVCAGGFSGSGVLRRGYGFCKEGIYSRRRAAYIQNTRSRVNGVSVTIFNRGEKTVVFNAALAFIDGRRRELGDVYFAKTEIEAGGSASFKDLYLKGDYKACRRAESLRWTIYELEEQ